MKNVNIESLHASKSQEKLRHESLLKAKFSLEMFLLMLLTQYNSLNRVRCRTFSEITGVQKSILFV